MQPSSVTVTANKFDPNTQTFSPAPTVNTTQSNVPTADQNLASFNQSMVKGSSGTITSSGLQTPNIVPLTSPKTPDYSSTIKTTLADLTNEQNNQQAKVDAANAEAKTQANNVSNLQSLLGGKGADTQKIYNEQGVTTAYNQIKDLNAQATGLQNEAQAIPIQIQSEFAGTGATDAGVAPIQTSRLRDNALKALSLGQQAAIATANYDKAKNYADMIVNAKYDKMEADIKAKLTNIESIKDFDITPAEKKLAEVTTKRLKYEEAQVAEMKEKETAINELIVNAYKQDAPKELTAKAEAIYKGGGDIKQVAAALGSWANNYYQNEALRMELSKKKIEDLKTNGLGVAPVGSITKELGVTTDDYMKGIAGTESAGSKDAYGGNDPYKVLSGQQTIADYNAMSQKEKDNTAYGKYQVMGFNIPKWTQEAFGRSMSIMEFLNSPEKQDALIRFRAEQDYATYGNWDDVASVWFSGDAASGNTRSDKFGTSVPSYISKYRNNMGITVSEGALPEGSIKYNGQTLNLTKLQQSQYTDINNEINTAVKTDIGVIGSFKNIEQTASLAKAGNPASQISLVFSYMKALDPTSTVREGEFATVQNAAGVPEQVRNQYNKVMSGNFLTANQVDNIVAEARGRANISQNNINSVLTGAEARAKTFGLPNGLVSETIKTRLNSSNELPKSPDESLVDDIFNMQQKVESTTPKYIIF